MGCLMGDCARVDILALGAQTHEWDLLQTTHNTHNTIHRRFLRARRRLGHGRVNFVEMKKNKSTFPIHPKERERERKKEFPAPLFDVPNASLFRCLEHLCPPRCPWVIRMDKSLSFLGKVTIAVFHGAHHGATRPGLEADQILLSAFIFHSQSSRKTNAPSVINAL